MEEYFVSENIRLGKEFADAVKDSNQELMDNIFVKKCRNNKTTLDDIENMVSFGVNPRCHNDRAFCNICSWAPIDTVLYFINNFGADINMNNGDAFVFAVYGKNISVAKSLIDMGININDNYKNKTFCAICDWASNDIVLYFINNFGADINSNDGYAMISAISGNNLPVIKLLLEIGIAINDNILTQLVISSVEAMKIFIEHGVDIYKIANIFWRYYEKDYDFIFNKIELFSMNGMDINTSFNNFKQNNAIYS